MPSPTISVADPIPARAGIGLRFQHHQAVLDTRPDVAWMEVHTENYMGGGAPLRYLDAIRRDTPISLHGVGLSLGSAEGIDPAHLERIRKVAERVEPGLMSEHIAWNVVGGTYLADLLPLPMTEEALEVVCRHVDQTQSHLKRRILVENPSSYIAFGNSIIPEWEFMAAVASRTGCGILCDVNNICVSAHNHGWDALAYIAALPPAAIGEIHLAGHSIKTLADGTRLRIDDHGSRVSNEVWSLYRQAIARFGAVPTLIEWDNDVPPLEVLLDEAVHADSLIGDASGNPAMPTLLETQRAMRASLVSRDTAAIASMLAGHVAPDRLDIYRNTFVHTLVKALRLCFPVTQRLVGEEFFEGAAQIFIGVHPPEVAWLDLYGGEFPGFLRGFQPAASIAYLGDVAELEWAVNGALHADDMAALNVADIGAVEAESQPRICFVPDPSIQLLRVEYPADIIWRAVLDADDEALGKVDLASGPRNILVERRADGVEVACLGERAWRFLARLCAGWPIEEAVADNGGLDCSAALAEHLALGRFAAFSLSPPPAAIDPGKIT